MVARRSLTPIELSPMPQVGAPTAGAWRRGTLVCDAAGVLWQCSVAGSPGTWLALGQTVNAWEPGAMRPWPGSRSAVPAGWLLCDGSLLSRSTYAALYAAICPSYTVPSWGSPANTLTVPPAAGTDLDTATPVRVSGATLPGGLAAGVTYYVIPVSSTTIRLATTVANALAGTGITLTNTGATACTLQAFPFGVGDGATTFALPDVRRRVPVGAGGVGTATLPAALGATGGEENHTLTVAEMPSHSHAMQVSGVGGTGAVQQANRINATFNPEVAVGGGGAHNTIQPSLTLHWIIKV